VFIGHGDSDKAASVNPFTRVYQEVWVAGDAGRDRYLKSDVGIRPEAIVEIGRPQLPELTRQPDAFPRLTVLYAPTWEGWSKNERNGSLPEFGPDLMCDLLTRPGLRVMYRPHPLTGHRDPATRLAHREVLRLLRSAGAGPARTRDRDPGDDTATERFWRDNPHHRILMGPSAPDLYACFERTDLLLADISSVTTDFLAADRPYAVLNVTGMSDDQFREDSPVASGGFVVGQADRNLDEIIVAARGGPDPTASARQRARTYLLGPRTDDPTANLRAELDRICM
jgi:hypothetical protein